MSSCRSCNSWSCKNWVCCIVNCALSVASATRSLESAASRAPCKLIRAPSRCTEALVLAILTCAAVCELEIAKFTLADILARVFWFRAFIFSLAACIYACALADAIGKPASIADRCDAPAKILELRAPLSCASSLPRSRAFCIKELSWLRRELSCSETNSSGDTFLVVAPNCPKSTLAPEKAAGV